MADGIADEVYDAALNRGMREYSLGAFLQSAHAIHGQDAKILNAASPQLVGDLHPGMLALRLVDPEAKDILAAVDVIGKHDIDGHLLDAILRAQRRCSRRKQMDRTTGADDSAMPRPLP